MTRNDSMATHGPTLILAAGPDVGGFTVHDLAKAVRKYAEPASIVAMVRYWSRLGVGSHAALEAARDRTAVSPEPSRPARHRGRRRGDKPRTRRA
jgi:hypothetical protein